MPPLKYGGAPVGLSRDMTRTRFARSPSLPSLRSRSPVPPLPTSGSPGSAAWRFPQRREQGHLRGLDRVGRPDGFEFEAARTSLGELIDLPFSDFDVDAHLTTYMFNAVLRLPAGPIQPYATAGVGAVRASGSIGVPLIAGVDVSAQNIGWNFGGGLYIVPLPFFAIRGDVRRFQTKEVSWDDIAGIGDLPLPELSYWRATAGLTVKF